MNRSQTLLVAMLMTAACGQEDKASPPPNELAAAPSAPEAAAEVPALEGQWTVAAVDGKPLSATSTAAFQGGKATISSGCHRRAWTYTQKGNVVAFTADPGGSSSCGDGTSAEQEAAFAAMEGASMAIFGKDGAEATLSGTGGTLTLQRR